MSNSWHAVLFLFSELTELMFHTQHSFCCSFFQDDGVGGFRGSRCFYLSEF